jgi:amino acid adenylation domain-containing protein
MNDHFQSIAELPQEQQAIQAKCVHPSGLFLEFKKEEIEQSIPDRFEKIVRQYPERLAIKMGDRPLSYGTLNMLANRIAHAILRERSPGGEPVALLFEHGVTAIAAILAVIKTGKIYVALDVSFPKARLGEMLEEADAALIVTNTESLYLAEQVAQPRQLKILNIDAIEPGLSTADLGATISPDSHAAIIFTSGSTGRPKGVIHTHRNILEKVMTGTNDFHISVEDRFSLLHSFSSNASVRQIFGSLLVGAGLFPFEVKRDGLGLLEQWLIREQISIFYSFPTLFRNLLESLTEKQQVFSSRLIFLGGEQVTKNDVELFKKHFADHSVLVNLMGSNETGSATYFLIDKATKITGNVVPVGYPVCAREVLLLDDQGHNVGHDLVGEIAIKSRYLSPGYWRNPKLTKAKFLPDSDKADKRIYLTGDVGRMAPDGCLYYLGRKDFTAKIRDYLVSLLEIEDVLREIDAIRDAVVVARDEPPAEKRLIAYVVVVDPSMRNTSALKRVLEKKLPSYMIPSRFVFLEALPLTPNGKIDRLSLPDPGRSRPQLDMPFVMPKSAVERELAKIWSDALFLDEVGIHDNFFDLGGNSLRLAQVNRKVCEILGREVPLVEMFGHPTISTLAAYLTQKQDPRDALEQSHDRAETRRKLRERRHLG